VWKRSVESPLKASYQVDVQDVDFPMELGDALQVARFVIGARVWATLPQCAEVRPSTLQASESVSTETDTTKISTMDGVRVLFHQHTRLDCQQLA
jgi:hypothetical protein